MKTYKQVEFLSRKSKLALIGVGIIIYTILISWFNNNFTVRSPIIFQNPIELRVISPLPKEYKAIDVEPLPTATKGATLKVTPSPTTRPKKVHLIKQVEASERVEILHTEIYNKISMLESGQGKDLSGKHGTCVSKGMTNSIGYAPHLNYCFISKTDEMATLGKWFQKRFDEGLSLEQSLCYYNEGIVKDTCIYYENYRTLSSR